MSQRAHLFQPPAAGPGGQAVSGRLVPPGVPRHRFQGVAAFLVRIRRLPELRAGRAHLPEACRTMRSLNEIEAVVIGASAGGIQALSVLLPALPASLRAPVF